MGVNSSTRKLFENLGFKYQGPKTTRTFIAEFQLGQETVTQYLGSSMHVFLLNIPRLEFAALVPKGEYVTMCLLGRRIDKELVERFLSSPEVKNCFPPEWSWSESACHCSPMISIGEAVNPFGNRIVLIGDSGVTRLYKDGIGAAYRTAKACAVASVFTGIGSRDFEKRYWPSCRKIIKDNNIGKLVFHFVSLIRRFRFLRTAVIAMVQREQSSSGQRKLMSMAMWNTFTGSTPYKDIFRMTLHPRFIIRLAMESLRALLVVSPQAEP